MKNSKKPAAKGQSPSPLAYFYKITSIPKPTQTTP